MRHPGRTKKATVRKYAHGSQLKLGLWYPKDSPFDLEAFSDNHYTGASLDRKSTTGGCQFLGKRLISWQCKNQTIVANSTTEAKYVAAANCYGQRTASTRTLNNREIELIATVDGHNKTITEESVRRHLKLADAEGISTLPTTEIFQQLALMGNMKRESKGFSGVETALFPTMLVTKQSSEGEDEAITKEMHDGLGRATTIASSLKAEQGSGNINKTQTKATPSGLSSPRTSSKGGPECHFSMADSPVQARPERLSNLPNEPPLGEGNTSRSREGSMQFLELMDICTKLSESVTSLENELTRTKAIYNKALLTLTKRVKKLEKELTHKRSRAVIHSLEDDEPSLDVKDSPKQGKMIEEIDKDENVNLGKSSKQGEAHETAGHTLESEFSTASRQKDDDDANLAETLLNIKRSVAKDKGKAILQESELPKKIKKKERIQISFNEELAHKLYAKELAKQLDERETVIAKDQAHDIDWSDPDVLRYHALQNRSFSKSEVRKNMCTYLKNQGGYKQSYFKEMSYEDIRPIFERVWDQNHVFVPKDSEIEKEVMKRSGFDLQQESSKKQKLDEQAEVQVDSDQEEDEMKKYMKIVPDEEIAIDGIPLATKPPIIVDWKIISEGKNIDREDLETLWKLVKAKYGNTRPEEAYERFGTNGGTTNLVNNRANSSGSSFMNVENSSISNTHIIDKIRKFKDLLIHGQAILVDEAGIPLNKVECPGDYDSVDEVESVDNDMACSLASEKNGNSKKRVTKGKDGVYMVLPPTTQEEQFADEKERKARTLLLMAVPKDHLRRFHAWMMPKRSGQPSRMGKSSRKKGYDRFQKTPITVDALVPEFPMQSTVEYEGEYLYTMKFSRVFYRQRFRILAYYQHDGVVLGYEEEMSRGIFVLRETDAGYYNIPLYSKFKQVEYKGVSHPLSGDYTPREQEEIDDSLYEYDDRELGAVSNHSVNDDPIHDPIPIPSIEQVTIATQKTQPQVPKPKQTGVPSCAQTHRQPIRTPVTSSPIPSNNRLNWNQQMERELGAGYSFERKPCFVCGSLSHLIKNCDYYEKKMAREAALKSQRVVHANVRQATPAWTNTNRVNKANQFTPRPVQLSNIRPNLSTASKTIKTGRVNVNTGHGNVNSGSVHVNSGTQIKSGASRFNTGKQYVNSGSVHVNTARVNRPVSNNTSPKLSQVNLQSPKKCFSKQRSPVNRPFSRNTAHKSNKYAVKGKMGTAVKTSAGCVWRKVIPLFNTNSGPTPESNVIVSRDHPLKHIEHRGIFDSGCSGHMTGNRAHLEDYQELSKVGSVTFGGSKEQAPSHMPMDDLLQAVPKLISRIDSLEMDLKQTKLTMGNAIVKLVRKVKKLEGFLKRRNLVLTDSEDDEPEAQGRKSQDDPQDSSIQGLVTPPTTKVHASGEEQVEDISPNTLEAAKTLSKVASLKSRSIDKGRRYKRRKETKSKKVVSSLDFQEDDAGAEKVNTTGEINTAGEINAAGEEVNTASKVNTGSIKLNTVIEQDSTAGEDKGQREGKAPMLSEETPKKSKEQILQEEASLAEAIRLDSLQKEEEAKQIHLDALLAQRIAEEEELTEQQKKRKAQVQFEAQYYTNEDWDLIRAKLEANAELSKSMLGSELQGEDFAKRMVDLVNQRKKLFAEKELKLKGTSHDQSQLKTYMMKILKNQWIGDNSARN
ncbi:hypothetical protein Tco_1532797 [Tanacetum coccineum]